MAGNNANVSSVALTGLQNDLRTLSSSLLELFDTMNADMSNVTEFWQDQKYQDFVAGYQPQINKCEEISQRYSKWCSTVLQDAIDRVVEIEMANVGGDAGSVSSVGGSAAAGAGVAGAAGGAAAASAKSSKMSGFNTGTKKATIGKPAKNSPGAMIASSISSPQNKNAATPAVEKSDVSVPQSANEACKADYGEDSRAVPADLNDPSAFKMKLGGTKTSGHWNAGGNLGGKVQLPVVGEISAGAQGGYESGKDAINSEREIAYKCE